MIVFVLFFLRRTRTASSNSESKIYGRNRYFIATARLVRDRAYIKSAWEVFFFNCKFLKNLLWGRLFVSWAKNIIELLLQQICHNLKLSGKGLGSSFLQTQFRYNYELVKTFVLLIEKKFCLIIKLMGLRHSQCAAWGVNVILLLLNCHK